MVAAAIKARRLEISATMKGKKLQPHLKEVAAAARARRLEPLPEWDQEFFNVETPILLDIVKGAHYLDITLLVNTGCKAIAGLIRGRSPEQVRETFGIVNDLSKSDEEDIAKQQKTWTKKHKALTNGD